MIDKIFSGAYLKRLDNIKQWQDMDVFKQESVSQHSYKVSIFCRILLEDIFNDSDNFDVLLFKLNCIDKAMFHDWDEALILRDISHETKYNSYNGEEIRNALDKLASYEAEKEFFQNGKSSSAKMLVNNIEKTNAEVKHFVKFCDWLALIFFIKREYDLGNKQLSVQWLRGKANLYSLYSILIDDFEKIFPSYVNSLKENINNLIKKIYG